MIYLDNAATSFPKPPCVLETVMQCVKDYCGNPGRSSHKLALKAAEKIYEARETVAAFINADNPENVCFTQNATHALNLAIKGVIPDGSHVIVSDLEHNSVLRPLHKLNNTRNITYSVYDSSLSLKDAITPLLKSSTTFVVSTIASNVTGRIINPIELSNYCEEKKLGLIIDASQYLGHKEFDFSQLKCNALCAPGHKALFGLQGSGFVCFSSDSLPETLTEGGSGSQSRDRNMPYLLPERMEAGTLSTPVICSLSAGISFINNIGLKSINEKLDYLTKYAYDCLSEINDVMIYSAENGIILFNYKGKSSQELASYLDNSDICTRGGLHCAPIIHKKLGTDLIGAVRVSFSYFNTTAEIEYLCKALARI